jgi:cytochrome c peroxidase
MATPQIGRVYSRDQHLLNIDKEARTVMIKSSSLFHFSTHIAALAAVMCCPLVPAQSPALNDLEKVGKAIFLDETLSIQQNQSCASCHSSQSGWTGPVAMVNAHGSVYEGSLPGRFGNRKPPSAAYATTSPVLAMDRHGLWTGGDFWDGRATGEKLGNPAADQAQGPFLNPAEQALPDSACVVHRVCMGSYSNLFQSVMGAQSCAISWPDEVVMACRTEHAELSLSPTDRNQSDLTFNLIALAIAAYEDSPEVNAFTSKFDLARKGKAKLTFQERKGFALFQGKGKCSKCHISTGQNPLFTDYTYDNLGLPKNPENPVYVGDPGFVDAGLGAYLKNIGLPSDIYEPNLGRQKVPTLRNVDKRPYPEFVKAFGHNGYFKSLEEIVHFYNTRDALPTCPPGTPGEKTTCWPAAEFAPTMNTAELGNLGLTAEEEAAIVAFLRTLNDGNVSK